VQLLENQAQLSRGAREGVQIQQRLSGIEHIPMTLSEPQSGSPVYDLPRMLGNRTSEQWIAQYSSSHQHPVNRFCHMFGIPLILVSVGVAFASFFLHRLWMYALGLFVIGWIFQFVGHAFEGKPPEFFHDWRFLFVGVRWWWAKINGRA